LTSFQTLHYIVRRLVRLTLWVTCVLFVLGVVLGAGLLWRLSTGPMQVHFLTPYLEDALASALGGRRIHVQNTILAWNVEAKSLELQARQVAIRQSDDTLLATIPTIDVELSVRALLRGTVALTAINIEEGSGVLIRTPEGTFQFGASSAATPPPEQLTPEAAELATAARPAQVIADLVQSLVAESGALSPLATLQELRLARGTLVVQDKRLGVTWHVTRFDLALRRQQHGLTGTGRITLAWQDALTNVNATLAYNHATEKLTLEAAFTDLRPFVLATLMVNVEALAGLDLPVNGSLAVTLDGHGRLETLHVMLTGGAGSVSFPPMWPEPLAISGIVVRGHLYGNEGTMSLDEATVTFNTNDISLPSLRVTGNAEGLGGDVTIRGELALTTLSLATLKRLWPVHVGSNARAWVIEHLQAGQVDQASANVVLAIPGGHVGHTMLKRLEGTLRSHLTLANTSAHFETALAYTQETEQFQLDLSFANLRPAALATVVPAWQTIAGLHVPLSGKLAIVLDTHGQLHDLRFKLSGGPGSVSHTAVFPQARRILSLTAQGRLDGTQTMLHLDEATVAFGTSGAAGPRLSISGTAQELQNTVTVNGQITLTGLHLAELKDYWPAGVSADARAWLTGSLVAGTVEEATAQVALTFSNTTAPIAKVERLHGTLRYQDCEVHYLRPLPPATGVSGSASFDQQGFRIQLNSGQVTDMQIATGTIEITGLDRGHDAMAIRVGMDAPLRTVLTLLNHPQLNLLADLGFNPAAIDGQSTTQLVLAFPLRGQILLQHVDITAHSTLTEVSIPQALLGQNIEHGQLTLDLNKAGMTLKGTATFATIPLTVAWQEAFTTEAVWKSDIRVTAAHVDPMQLDKFGLHVTDFVAGPLAASVTARFDRQGKSILQASVNLQDAELTLPLLGWRKPLHEPGEAQGTVHFMGSQAPAQGDFTIQAGTLATSGAFQFSRAAEPDLRLDLRDLAVGYSRFNAVTIEHRHARIDVTLGEGVLDLQPLMRGLLEKDAPPGNRGLPDPSPYDTAHEAALVVHLHAPALHRVSFGDDRYWQDVEATLTHGPEGWRAIDIAARIPDALVQGPRAARKTADQPQPPRTFSVQYQPTAQGTYALSVHTNDLGAALRACNLRDGITGGRLTIAGQTTTPRPNGPLQGTVEVKDFTIQQEPVLARLLAMASLKGLLNTLHSDGLVFSHLVSDFALTDRVVTMQQLRAYGGALGLTVAGSIDIPASSVDLKGTIIPLYEVNTVLGKIPVIGDLLLGGKGQGLVAIAVRVTGRLPDPQVSVNPASVVTPGFLRGFFDLFDGSARTDSEQQPLK
jgi:hypothetical protein